MELEQIEAVEKVHVLHPEDVVCVTTRARLTPEAAHRIREALDEVSARTGCTFILFDDVDLDVYRPVKE